MAAASDGVAGRSSMPTLPPSCQTKQAQARMVLRAWTPHPPPIRCRRDAGPAYTTRILTSTYRCKPPPKRKGRKLAEITGPAVVTSVDPKEAAAAGTTREVVRRRRLPGNQPAWRERISSSQARRPSAGVIQPSSQPQKRRPPPMTTASRRSSPRAPTRQCSTSASSSRWRSSWPTRRSRPRPRTSSTG